MSMASLPPLSTIDPEGELLLELDDLQRLSVEQYLALLESGVLESDAPVELLEGLLVKKMGKNPPHGTCIRKLARLLTSLIGDHWSIHTQDPLQLPDGVPEPDLLVVQVEADDYAHRLPSANDVGLVIEVCDTTLRRDRGIKLRSYARAALREYWIVNLRAQVVEVYTDPISETQPPTYRQRRDFSAGEFIPVTLDGQLLGQIAVDAILV